MRDIEKIKDKVLMLLKLVQNNENEYEVEYALTKAEFLIEKYELDNIKIYKKITSNIEPIREFVDINLKKPYMLRKKFYDFS